MSNGHPPMCRKRLKKRDFLQHYYWHVVALPLLAFQLLRYPWIFHNRLKAYWHCCLSPYAFEVQEHFFSYAWCMSIMISSQEEMRNPRVLWPKQNWWLRKRGSNNSLKNSNLNNSGLLDLNFLIKHSKSLVN